MNKEVQLGLSFLAGLLVVLGIVVVRRFSLPDAPPTAAIAPWEQHEGPVSRSSMRPTILEPAPPGDLPPLGIPPADQNTRYPAAPDRADDAEIPAQFLPHPRSTADRYSGHDRYEGTMPSQTNEPAPFPNFTGDAPTRQMQSAEAGTNEEVDFRQAGVSPSYPQRPGEPERFSADEPPETDTAHHPTGALPQPGDMLDQEPVKIPSAESRYGEAGASRYPSETAPDSRPPMASREIPPAVPGTMPGSRPAASGANIPPRTYIVREGDTLSGIARQELGDSKRWTEIYQLNRQVLGGESLRPGTRLVMPSSSTIERIVRPPEGPVRR